MAASTIRVSAVLLICLLASVGCNPSNNAEVTQAKADAEAARAEAQAAKVEFAKAKERAEAAEGELAKLIAAQAQPKPVDEDRRAAEWVMRIGGLVEILDDGLSREFPPEKKLPDTPFKVTRVGIVGVTVTNDGIKYLQRLKHLKRLDIGPGVTDFTFLNGMGELNELQFGGGAQITDSVLVHLKDLKSLQTLILESSDNRDITDAGLENLQNLKNLQMFWIVGSDVTDAGLKRLGELSKLRRLGLVRTKVTDAGLSHLKGLADLRHLQIDNTKVTDDGVKALKAALPKCTVVK